MDAGFNLHATITFWEAPPPVPESASIVVICPRTRALALLDPASGCVFFWSAGPARVGEVILGNDEASRPYTPRLVTVLAGPTEGGGRIDLISHCTHKYQPALIAVTEDGSVRMVSMYDGSFLAESPHLLPHSQCITVLPTSLRAHLIAVGSTHCSVSIVDTDRLRVVAQLEVPAPGFTVDMASVPHPGDAAEVTLVGVLADRSLRYWLVHDEGGTVQIHRRCSTALPQRGIPVYVDHHRTLPLVLVIASDGWSVFCGMDPTPIVKVEVDTQDAVLNAGCFTFGRGYTAVAVLNATGRVRLYQMSSETLEYAHQKSPAYFSTAPADVGHHETQIKPGVPKLMIDERIVEDPTIWGMCREISDPPRVSICGVASGELWLGCVEGDAAPSLNIVEKTSIPLVWEKVHEADSVLSDEVSCSLLQSPAGLTGEVPVMVTGWTSGSIEVTEVGVERTQKRWDGHTTTVRHVVAINNTEPFLVSAADDGTVKCWKWGVWSLEASFAVHCGHVAQLAAPPKSITSRHNIDLLSIGGDGNVACYSVSLRQMRLLLYGHGLGSSPPSHVYVIPDSDSIVIADRDHHCSSIWCLASGRLIRKYKGAGGRDLLSKLSDEMNYVDYSHYAAHHYPFTPPGTPLASPRKSAAVPTAPRAAAKDIMSMSIPLGRKERAAFPTPVLVVSIPKVVQVIQEAVPHRPDETAVIPPCVRSILSYLLKDDHHPSIENLKDKLGIAKNPYPRAAVSFHARAPPDLHLTALPAPCEVCSPYQSSPESTARRLIALLVVLYSINGVSTQVKGPCKDAIDHVASAIPQNLMKSPRSYEADLLYCLHALKEPTKVVQFATRCVLKALIRNTANVGHLVSMLDNIVHHPSSTEDERHIAVLGLAISVIQSPSIPQDFAAKACDRLVNVATAPYGTAYPSVMGVALGLLSDYYSTWSNYLHVSPELLHALFAVCTSDPELTQRSILPRAAFKALCVIGAHNLPTFFVFANQVLSDTAQASPAAMQRSDSENLYPNHTLMLKLLASMMTQSSEQFVPHILRTTATVLRVIDPHFPVLRTKCLPEWKQTLLAAVKTFPMIAFSQKKQHLAAGDNSGTVVVWDIRTASKLLVWDAHPGGTSCVCFSQLGCHLATFGCKEGSVKIWYTDMSILAIFTSSHKPTLVASRDLTSGPKAIPYDTDMCPDEVLRHVGMVWTSPRTLEITLDSSGTSHTLEFDHI
eukprot:Sspe_Gene.48734::Locus_25610_Transcript_1_1_Confidence_1.000_Length_3772::g.48734::m.48734